MAETNPAIDTPSPADARPRDRVLSDDELGAIWRAATEPEVGPGGLTPCPSCR
jgi:hypothetical protein